jgi:hypothetical protein
MAKDSRRDKSFTEPSAVAPDARVYYGDKPRPCSFNTEVESGIRRYRARFCNGVCLFPKWTLANISGGAVTAQSVLRGPN